MHFSVYPKKGVFLYIFFKLTRRHVMFQHENPANAGVFTQLYSRSKSRSDIADVQVSLFYPPVGRHFLWFVALHVLLHGGQARAEVLADGALVRRCSVVSAQVLDHSRVVSGPLVTQLTLKWLLT